jgi:hypothetical protein
MEALIHFRRFNCLFLLALLLSTALTGNVLAQTDTLKLYIDENGRLKQQKTALLEENTALKQALQAEQQKAAQLKSSLDQVEPSIRDRDRQVAEMRANVAAANQRVMRQELLSAMLAWIIVVLLLSLIAYSQRAALRRILRSVLDRRNKTAAAPQAVRPANRFEGADNEIRPEELFDRLYGRRQA